MFVYIEEDQREGRNYKVKKGGNWENQGIISRRMKAAGLVKTEAAEVETENCLLFSNMSPHLLQGHFTRTQERQDEDEDCIMEGGGRGRK